MPDAQSQEPPNPIAALRQDVVSAAEGKLGRSLTERERTTVHAFSSPRMLQSMQRRFTQETTTAAAIERDLVHLASVASEPA